MDTKKYEWLVVHAIENSRHGYGSILVETDEPTFDAEALTYAQGLATTEAGVIISRVSRFRLSIPIRSE